SRWASADSGIEAAARPAAVAWRNPRRFGLGLVMVVSPGRSGRKPWSFWALEVGSNGRSGRLRLRDPRDNARRTWYSQGEEVARGPFPGFACIPCAMWERSFHEDLGSMFHSRHDHRDAHLDRDGWRAGRGDGTPARGIVRTTLPAGSRL